MQRASIVLTALIALAVVPASIRARADVVAPSQITYDAFVEGHSVIICPTAVSGGSGDLTSVCLESNEMVRENLDTDEAHSIATCCDRQGDLDGDDLVCVIDECVRPGSYRYGLVPLPQCPPTRWAELTHYLEVEIIEELGRCELSPGNLGRWPFSGDVDWGDLPPEESCNEPIIPDDAPDVGVDSGAGSVDDGGCSVAPRVGVARGLTIYGSFVLAGLFLVALRAPAKGKR